MTSETPASFERRTLKVLAYSPDGVTLDRLAELVCGDRWDDADYQRVRRVVERNRERINFAYSNGIRVVSPTADLFNLITARQKSKSPEGGKSSRDTPLNLLKSVNLLNDEGKNILLDRYQSYIDAIEDNKIILSHRDRNREEYLIKDYKTRFTDDGRADRLWRQYNEAWEEAKEEYDNAVSVTLTTDPKAHDSLKDAWDEQSESWNRLMSWLASDSRLGERPDYICVREPQEQGNPHIHAVIFGVSYLVSTNELSNYWSKHQGKIVHAERLKNRRGKWKSPKREGEDDRTTTNAKGYIGKYLSKLLDHLEDDADDLYLEDAETTNAWKLALYWAMNRRFYTTSQALIPDDEENDNLPHVPEYEFHRACSATEIPAYVIRNTREKKRAEGEEHEDTGESEGDPYADIWS